MAQPPPSPRSVEQLREAAASCQACDLWENATQTVFGEGSEHSRMMLVGEQPGDQEDLQGKPFVGPAGRLVQRTLEEAPGGFTSPTRSSISGSRGEASAGCTRSRTR